MNIQNQYIYKAYVESVYDGDTITCTIDCRIVFIVENKK